MPLSPAGDDEELNSPLAPRHVRPPAAPVGATAARGFYWLTAVSLVTKVIGMGTQIVLSWFVGRRVFGLVATSTTIASFIWLIQDAGLSQILIKRQRRFKIWCTPIFWLSIALGLLAAILNGAAGWIMAHLLHQPALLGLMLLLALRGFVSAPSAVPCANLNKDLRFGLLAALGLILVSIERSLMMLFTSPLFRWGAYGFIIAMLIVSAVRTILMWSYARSPVKPELQLRRWKYVVHDSWLLMVAQAFQTIAFYGDNLLLALFQSQDVVGDYYWAYNLSLQTIMLLTSNLGGVLFPALSRLQGEPERMRQAFIRAARMLTLIGVPGCLLQAALARPIVVLIFGGRWLTAVPALQVLSLGMAMGLLNYPALGLLRAQGRFSTERTLSGICAGLFLVAALLGAMLGGSLSMAIAVAIYNVVGGILFLRTAIGPAWKKIAEILLPPIAFSIVAIGCGYLLGLRVSIQTRWGCLEQIGLITVIGCPLYAAAIRVVMPDLWKETLVLMRPIWQKVIRTAGL